MRDLFRSLDDYPPELLEALAVSWAVELPRDEPLRSVIRLGEAMLVPGAVEASIARLSPPAREALAEVIGAGGSVAARTLGMRFGQVRRFGPAALRRERPWQSPGSPLEELYYSGLLYRAFGDLGDYVGELLVIPDQLLERMPSLPRAPLLESLRKGTPEGAPDVWVDTLVEDLMAEAVRLRQQPVRLQSPIEPGPALQTHLDLGSRLLGPNTPTRLHLLWRTLLGLGLVEHDGRLWRLSVRTRQWLGQTDAEQWLSCFLAWRDDRSWDELYDLPDIVCDARSCPNEPWEARKRLCAVLEQIPEGEWYELESLIAALRRFHPDYLRPDGDMDAWFIREAGAGESLRGIDHWAEVEGALATYLLSGPLHWLGIIDLGQTRADLDDQSGQTLLRISLPGKELLGELPPHLEGRSVDAPVADIDARLQVSIRLRQSRYQRYQMERLARWQGQDATAQYALTEDSVWQAQNAGISTDQILTFLKRITANRVPDIVSHTLQAWGQRFGSATVRRAVLLETVDAATMQRIRQVSSIAALMGQPLGATRCLVQEDDMEKLVAELKRRNIWPRIVR